MVFIEEKRCKGCGICVSLCPKGALGLDKYSKAHYANPEACISCGMCELWCPDYAITVEKEKKVETK